MVSSYLLCDSRVCESVDGLVWCRSINNHVSFKKVKRLALEGCVCNCVFKYCIMCIPNAYYSLTLFLFLCTVSSLCDTGCKLLQSVLKACIRKIFTEYLISFCNDTRLRQEPRLRFNNEACVPRRNHPQVPAFCSPYKGLSPLYWYFLNAVISLWSTKLLGSRFISIYRTLL